MKQNQLVIGNYIKCKVNGAKGKSKYVMCKVIGLLYGSDVISVQRFDNNEIMAVSLKDIKPIELTEFFLMKNGFKKGVLNKEYVISVYDSQYKDKYYIVINTGAFKTCHIYKYCSLQGCYEYSSKLLYVHKLQNLISLLNLKLTLI